MGIFFHFTQIVQRQSYIKFCEHPTRNNNNNSQLNFRVQNDGKILLCLYSFSIFLCTRLKVVILFFKIKRRYSGDSLLKSKKKQRFLNSATKKLFTEILVKAGPGNVSFTFSGLKQGQQSPLKNVPQKFKTFQQRLVIYSVASITFRTLAFNNIGLISGHENWWSFDKDDKSQLLQQCN